MKRALVLASLIALAPACAAKKSVPASKPATATETGTGGTPPAGETPPTGSTGSTGLDGYVHGVTVDDVEGLDQIVDAIGKLSATVTTRIVFDEGQKPAYYTDAVKRIGGVSNVMGEVLDSFFVKDLAVEDYKKRTQEYVDAFGAQVDLWEIGNEVNGEWLGETADVVAKIQGAYDVVTAKGGKTALTLYYNVGCWEKEDHEMLRWTEAYVPAAVREGVDYALISYYEEDCENQQPEWGPVFDRLGELFPKAKLGFGETGIKDPAKKADYLKRYYGYEITHSRYVGGHFWWYFRQDMVPATQPLWQVLDGAMQAN